MLLDVMDVVDGDDKAVPESRGMCQPLNSLPDIDIFLVSPVLVVTVFTHQLLAKALLRASRTHCNTLTHRSSDQCNVVHTAVRDTDPSESFRSPFASQIS
jgi:hypothetical protein